MPTRETNCSSLILGSDIDCAGMVQLRSSCSRRRSVDVAKNRLSSDEGGAARSAHQISSYPKAAPAQRFAGTHLMLSDRERAIVKATVPALRAHGGQARSLAASVLTYAENIDRLGALGGMVERIAAKHVSLEILPEHYPI